MIVMIEKIIHFFTIERYEKYLTDENGMPSSNRLMSFMSFRYALFFGIVYIILAFIGKNQGAEAIETVFYTYLAVGVGNKLVGTVLEQRGKKIAPKGNICDDQTNSIHTSVSG